MRTTLYKVVFPDKTQYYTNDRTDVIDAINNYHIDDEQFKPYNINTVNGILYNGNQKTRGVESIERFQVADYFQEYKDRYTKSLLENAERFNKDYSHHSIKRFQNHFLSFINNIEITGRNNGDSDETIHKRILDVGLFNR
jgi:hypothetical protein